MRPKRNATSKTKAPTSTDSCSGPQSIASFSLHYPDSVYTANPSHASTPQLPLSSPHSPCSATPLYRDDCQTIEKQHRSTSQCWFPRKTPQILRTGKSNRHWKETKDSCTEPSVVLQTSRLPVEDTCMTICRLVSCLLEDKVPLLVVCFHRS